MQCSTPLLDKWRSPGAACDCGGWDEKCPVDVSEGKKPKGRENDELAGADGSGALRISPQVRIHTARRTYQPDDSLESRRVQ